MRDREFAGPQLGAAVDIDLGDDRDDRARALSIRGATAGRAVPAAVGARSRAVGCFGWQPSHEGLDDDLAGRHNSGIQAPKAPPVRA
jgi:hypothetical protein